MKLSVRKPWILLPLLVVAMSLQQCSCSEMMGALLVSQDDEQTLGAEFHRQLLSKPDSFPVFSAGGNASRKALESYLNGCFARVHDAVPSGDRTAYHDQFRFTIIDSDVSNAFAVPGGYVYLYTGILKDVRSESELVGILGHELAHITRHHYRDALASQMGVATLAEMLGGGSSQVAQFVSGIFQNLMAMQLSQENEFEADHYGTVYLANTGRNPLGIADFFSRMADQSSVLAWFSTHPPSSERVQKVRDQVNSDASMRAQSQNAANEHATEYVNTTCAASGTNRIDYCPN